MSHELRTPLNGILGYAQILERDKDITPKQKDAIQIIQQCGSHLLTLINDILDLSKIEARRMELYPRDFHFPSFLQEVAEICRIRAEQKEIAFSYQVLNQLPTAVHADDKRLRQVLINLLGNAIKFTDKGEVNFKVGILETEKNSIQSNSLTQNFKFHFQIEDTGVGMEPEQLERIFLPFEQVGDRAGRAEGTGLGLAITQKIVQMMGGELQVESTLDLGSNFWLFLELSRALQDIEVVPVDLSKNIIGFKGEERKILVVDDQPENRSFLFNLLEPIGFKLMQASNGEEGLDKAAAFQPDLIITDLLMPVMDGFEMTRHLRKLPKFKDTILIASSANLSNCKQQNSLEAGCDDFISKPIQAQDLLKKIQDYLELEWVYAANERSKLQNHEFLNSFSSPTQTSERVVELPEELVALLKAARIGDIEGIEQEANRLKRLDNKYISFATKLLQLAQEFEEKEILKLVKRYISQN
jgi:CheY-like chemotaxis protein